MTHHSSQPALRTERVLTVVLVYAVFASLWILLSDKAVAWLVTDPAKITVVSTVKGWAFVGVTSLLLFGLMRRLLQGAGVAPDDIRVRFRTLRLPFALIVVAILALVAGGVAHTLESEQTAQTVRLEAIAELKARQIADWLKERKADADFVRTSRVYAEYFSRWRSKGETAAARALWTRLDQLRSGAGFRAALILDGTGTVLWDSSGAGVAAEPELSGAVKEAVSSGRIGEAGPYRDAQGQVFLDFVAPLSTTASHAAVVVLRAAPADFLFPTLQSWPAPTATGETLLFRRDGNQLFYLNHLGDAPQAATKLSQPLVEGSTRALAIAGGQPAPVGVVKDIDYRGIETMGVIRSVPGTDWFVEAKIDRAEAYRAATSGALWIGLAGMLALFAAGSGLFLFRQRQELAAGQRERALQAERLRALTLLDALAASSDDPIFAKDLDGRYVLFNRAAERLTGKAAADVLGKDDYALFPAEQAARMIAQGTQAVAENRTLTVEECLATPAGERILLATKGPLHDAHGKVIGLFGISRDITERKQAEARLRASELRFRHLLNDIPTLAVQGYGRDGTTRYWNRASERLYGYSAEEAIGRSLTELIIPPGMRDDVRQTIGQMFDTGQPIAAGELSLMRKDGSRVAVYSCHAYVHVPGESPEMFCLDIDLTERKRMEETLRSTEQQLRLFIEHAPAAIAMFDREMRFLFVSQRFLADYLDTAADVIGNTLYELFPEIPERWKAIHQRCLAGEAAHCEEEPFPRGEGRTDWVKWAIHPWYDAAGGVGGLILISELLTARKEAEANLQRMAQDMAATIQAIPDLMFEMDGEGRYLAVKAGRAELLAAPEARLLGRIVTDVLPAEAAQTTLAALAEAAQSGADYGRVIKLALPMGERWFELSVARKAALNGEAQRFVVLSRDVTERRRAEEQLRKLSLAVEQSQECVVITDLDSNIEYVNDAFVRVTGYSREEVIGKNPRFLSAGKTPPQTYQEMWAALTQGLPWKGELYNRRKNGEEYVEYATITPIRQPDGRLSHYVAIKDDTTEKRRLGDELDRYRHHLEELVAERTAQLADARARAEAANVAKSAFLANMSHEIRTPMNGIIGLTHLLQQSAVTPDQAKRLGKIDTAAHHLLTIINDILDLSKIEAGRLELEQTDFDLEAVFDNVRSLIAEQANSKGLAIEAQIDDVPRWLKGDSTRIRQALLNYASNAVKFTEHGSVVMRARVAERCGRELLVRFEVEDTGIGIAPDVLARLFEAFEQADASTTRHHGGTGLGLAITRRLANLMGGQAGAQSEAGRGSRFWFTARLAPARAPLAHSVPGKPAAASARELLRRQGAGATFLLAEDNTINREVALELLHAAGCVADTAEDGLAAVEKARSKHYDLILMDMQMPRMDGLSAARAIRDIPGYAQVPILAMTANAFDEDREACLAAGMNDHIAKPVDPESFYALLLKFVAERSPAATDPALALPPAAANPANLDAIAGLDVAAGLRFAGGKWSFYSRLLRRFAEDHASDIRRVREHLAAGDMAAARRLAHSLKSVSATLGAVSLQAASAELEQGILAAPDGGREVDSLCETAENELATLVSALMASQSAR